MSSVENIIIRQTKCWIKSVVIHYNFCPFAKREFDRNSVLYKVLKVKSNAQILESLILECNRLAADDTIATTFIILSDCFRDFFEFLDLIEISNNILIAQGFEGIYQLASFHPDYCFANNHANDPSNFTNRSPYPMLHILRESSIEQQLQHYPDAENIPEQNILKSSEIGGTKFQSLIQKCMKQETEY